MISYPLSSQCTALFICLASSRSDPDNEPTDPVLPRRDPLGELTITGTEGGVQTVSRKNSVDSQASSIASSTEYESGDDDIPAGMMLSGTFAQSEMGGSMLSLNSNLGKRGRKDSEDAPGSPSLKRRGTFNDVGAHEATSKDLIKRFADLQKFAFWKPTTSGENHDMAYIVRELGDTKPKVLTFGPDQKALIAQCTMMQTLKPQESGFYAYLAKMIPHTKFTYEQGLNEGSQRDSLEEPCDALLYPR